MAGVGQDCRRYGLWRNVRARATHLCPHTPLGSPVPRAAGVAHSFLACWGGGRCGGRRRATRSEEWGRESRRKATPPRCWLAPVLPLPRRISPRRLLMGRDQTNPQSNDCHYKFARSNDQRANGRRGLSISLLLVQKSYY